MDIKNFFLYEDIKREDLGNGVSRKILAYHENLMTVEVSFEEGAIGAPHSHPHEQIVYVLEGTFQFNIDEQKNILKVGDTAYIQPDLEHDVICLKKGKLLDIFTPHRQDFVK